MVDRPPTIRSSVDVPQHRGFSDSAESSRPPRLVGQLVGRTAEYDRITALVRGVGAGRGAIAIVEGEPGIGKTSLLAALAQLAAAQDVKVLRGRTRELEQRVPFAAMRSIRPTTGTVASSSGKPIPLEYPAPSTDKGEFSRELATSECFLAATEAYCRAAGPAVVILDDAQWADSSSLFTLRRLGEAVQRIPLVIVVAVRPLPRESEMSALLAQYASWGAEHLRLGPMSEPEVAALVEIALGSPAGPHLSALVSGAGGNPLYVIELLAGLMRAELIELGEITAESGDFTVGGSGTLPLPRSLTDAIARRLDFLPSPARQILPMAAALGPGVEAIELATVLDAALIDVWTVISEAFEAGLLVRVGAELVFRHELIRQVLAEQLPTSTRSTLRRRAARILMSMEAPVERIAAYLRTNDAPLDTNCLEWLIDVADTLMTRAPQLAVILLTRAKATAGLDAERGNALQVHHVRALLCNGEAAQAEAAARRALAEDAAAVAGRPDQTHDSLLWLLAHACFVQGRVSDALAVAESALTRTDLTPQQQGRYRGFCALSYVLLERFDAAEEAAAQAVSIGEASADPVTSELGYAALGALRFNQGFLGEAQELGHKLTQGHDADDGGRAPLSLLAPYALTGQCLTELDRLPAAEKTLGQAVRYSEHNNGLHLPATLLELARLHFLQGRWDDAMTDLRSCRDAPDVFGQLPAVEYFVALIAVHRGTLTITALPPAPNRRAGSRSYRHVHSWVDALAHEARRPDLALKTMVDACAAAAAGPNAATIYHLYPDMARLAAITGRSDVADKVASAAEELESRYSTHSRHGTAALCRGLAENRPALLREAARSFREAGRPWYEGQAHENLAALLAMSGHLDEARAALGDAVERYTGLGAQWDIARVEARLREYGIRRGRRGPRNRPKSGWAALTPTERKVADLVAQGCSNSDIATTMFLSPRTVQSHVSSILAKLDLQSRVQVAVAMTRQNS